MKRQITPVILIILIATLTGCASVTPTLEELTNIEVPKRDEIKKINTNVHDYQFSVNPYFDIQILKSSLDSLILKSGYILDNSSDYNVDLYCVNVDSPDQLVLEKHPARFIPEKYGDPTWNTIPATKYTSSALFIWKKSSKTDPNNISYFMHKTSGEAGIMDSINGGAMMRKSMVKALKANLAKGIEYISEGLNNPKKIEKESLLIFSPKTTPTDRLSFSLTEVILFNLNTKKIYHIRRSPGDIYHATLPPGKYIFSKMLFGHYLKQETKERNFKNINFEIKEGNRVYLLENDTFLNIQDLKSPLIEKLISISPDFKPIKIKTF